MKKYDFIIVGAGLSGSVCARELTDKGYKCLIIDKRNHIGGNCYSEKINDIIIHKYGGHIFHTDNKIIWDYLNQFCEFSNYVAKVKAVYNNKIYSSPINLSTLNQIWGVTTPSEAEILLNKKKIKIDNPKNLEEWALSQVGEEIYKMFIYGYTKKQWNTEPKNLPISIIKRLQIRLNYDDSYLKGRYQGIPINGYDKLFEKMIKGCDILLNTPWEPNKFKYKNIIFTGRIDEFFNYKFGKLEYRSLRFGEEHYNIKDFQGVATVNYTNEDIPFTRIHEHKHYNFTDQNYTIITKEFPSNIGDPFYPINNSVNDSLYNKYVEYSKNFKNIHFGGRLGLYKYMDMDQIVENALLLIQNIIKG